MIYIWALFLFAPLAIILLRYLSGKQIADGSMLLFGLSYYCSLPFFVYGTNGYEDGPGALIWSESFQSLYGMSLTVVIFFAAYILSFLFGKALPVPSIWTGLNRPLGTRVLNSSIVLLFSLWLVFAYKARANLFAGYTVEYDPLLMGPLATVNLISVLVLLNIKQWRQSKPAETILLILLLANSILLLSMGGRMYVLAPLISLFLQYINTNAKAVMSRIKLFFVFSVLIFALLAIGVWRLGERLDLSTVLVLGIAEPILTSISMTSLYDCEGVGFFHFPYNFLSSIINFLPSAIFPEKIDFLFDLDPSGKCFYSPFGATHISAALFFNFGIFGTSIFIIFFSAFLKSLRLVQKNGWWLYYYVCGLLPFMFFRDGFLIFNKALVGSGILITLFICFMSRLRIK